MRIQGWIWILPFSLKTSVNGNGADFFRIGNTGRGTDQKGRTLVLNRVRFGQDKHQQLGGGV